MHTNRLKRKLNDLGVDPSSSKANESFCLIGTPLPPLEKSKDTGEFVPLWKQEARDEKGRRRLHGAFTGGFSAGYFNTVGSKEGWTPSTFVSSRSDRAKQKAVRPEDFMDEEDLAELRESRTLVDETEEMDLLGGTKAEMKRRGGAPEDEDDSIAAKLSQTLLPAPVDSVGAKVLRKMGWRPGYGVGPRITYEQRKRQDRQAAIVTLGPSAMLPEKEAEEDEEAKKHMYPPRDTPVLLAPRKDNTHGLGYTPGLGLNESLGVAGEESSQKGPKISAGFGLGALNDAEDDDVDVYDTDFKRMRNRMVYDADEDGERIVMGGGRRGAKTAVHADSKVASASRTFGDGRPVLPGFVIYDTPVVEDRWYPLPEVPKAWTPNPRRVWEKDKENLERQTKKPGEPVSHAEWKAGVTPDKRGSILGETPLPSAPRSVFEYLSQKDRERLKNITSQMPAPSVPSGPATLPPPVPTEMATVEPRVAKAALQGFQPFTADPVKQQRYTIYLQSQAEPDAPIPHLAPLPHQSQSDFKKELEDYAKAAKVFKPLSAAMAGRFTSAAVVEHGPQINEGLHKPEFKEETKEEKERQREEEKKKREEEEKELNPKAHAARMGMYGKMTREVTPWVPVKLLCKRFGVKEPEILAPEPADVSAPGGASTQQANWTPEAVLADTSGFMSASTSATNVEGTYVPNTSGGQSSGAGRGSGGRRDLNNIGMGEDDTQGVDTLTYERPSMDIFKAIFASDDEESEDEDVKKEEDEEDVQVPVQRDEGEPVPARVPIDSKPVPAYDPQTASASVVEKVDLATFKPTFIPRSERSSGKAKDKEKREKKEKKKKSSKKTLVSFEDEMEEGGGPAIYIPKEKKEKGKGRDKRDREKEAKDKDRDRPKKKRREEPKVEEQEDDEMWVEKPPPDVVNFFEVNAAAVHGGGERRMDVDQYGPQRGRKRAVDFM